MNANLFDRLKAALNSEPSWGFRQAETTSEETRRGLKGDIYDRALRKVNPQLHRKSIAWILTMSVALSSLAAGMGGLVVIGAVDNDNDKYNRMHMGDGEYQYESFGWEDYKLPLYLAGGGLALLFACLIIRPGKDQDLEDAIDMIVDLRQQFPEIPEDIDVEKLRRLAEVLPVIISHMSKYQKGQLRMISNIGDEVLENTDWIETVTSVFVKHFKDNPKDLEKVINAYRGVIDFNYAQQIYGSRTPGMKR